MPPTLPSLDVAALPKLPSSELTLLWVNDWYDGPLEAMVEHSGKRCLMVLANREKLAIDEYQWVLFELTAAQAADEERWHALFAEHVGDHWCFHDASIVHPAAREPATPDAFWGAYESRPSIVLERASARGWTDEIPKR